MDSSSSPWLKEQGGWDAAQTGLSPAGYIPGMFSLVDTDSDPQVFAELNVVK